jgi:ArsR family transcriptional regulator, arsenate/arsenite/antimonite-responsive transcriptional repressor
MTILIELDDVQVVAEVDITAVSIFKALSDPTRFRIFSELLAGDSCNCELRDNLGLAPNLLSHHLKILEKAGLLQARRDRLDGRWIYYSINRPALAQWHGWLTTFFDPQRIPTRPLCGPEGEVDK